MGALRVVTFNIRAGRGLDDTYDMERIARVVLASGADVAGLQEVDCGLERSGRLDQAQWLAGRLGWAAAYGPALDLGLAPDGRRQLYGNALLSRHPIRAAQVHPLPYHPVAGYWKERRACLVARVAPPDGPEWTVAVTHLGLAPAEQALQAAALAALLAGQPDPLLLLGDLNAPPGAPRLAPLWALCPDAAPPAGTFPAGDPQERLDYVLVRSPATAAAFAVLPTDASDHRPLAASVHLIGPAYRPRIE